MYTQEEEEEEVVRRYSESWVPCSCGESEGGWVEEEKVG